jgi:hypothetical protein
VQHPPAACAPQLVDVGQQPHRHVRHERPA